MDNVYSYEVVLPDGTITLASPIRKPDLFWGLKGGFNNFGMYHLSCSNTRYGHAHPQFTMQGIVTHAVVKAFPLGKVYVRTRSMKLGCIWT